MVYVASTVASGPFPSPTPKFNQAEAALAVRAALESYLAKEGGSIGSPEYSLEALTNAAGLAYQLSGDSIGLIYKVEFTLASPHFGTMLAFVDAQTNTVVTFKRQAKN
ncbi:MAG: hypothetical protein EOP07_17915 [Proteobacteria bacterium]|nr:MAG: hypothetical protein EOP07_17915 [Pseudomonadota bacterium]